MKISHFRPLRLRVSTSISCLFAITMLLVLFASPSTRTAFGQAGTGLPYSYAWSLYSTHAEPNATAPTLMAILWITPDKGVNAYSNNPGTPFAKPTVVTPTSKTPGVTAGVIYHPGVSKPDILDASKTVMAYAKKTPVFIPLTLNAETLREPLPSITVDAKLSMLLCSDKSCWPVETTLTNTWNIKDYASLPMAQNQLWWPEYLAAQTGKISAETTSDPATKTTPQNTIAQAPEGTSLDKLEITPTYFQPGLEVTGLAKAMIFGLIAGFILNFMPCVLPVVSLKFSTLMATTTVEDKKTKISIFRQHNIFFALGVLIYFFVLGLVLGAAGMAWGQIFQLPETVLVLTAIVFPLGLSLFGLFNLPIVDFKAGAASEHKRPRTQALFTGFLATLLATPCSGPFLGGVLGWALTQSSYTIVLVFQSIGLGMALPYLAMTVFPGLVRFFPKPGAWTLHLEKLVGFFLMATCVYLLNILPTDYLLPGMILLWTTAFAAWIWGQWTNLSHSAARRWSTRTLAVLLVVIVGAYALQPPDEEAQWIEFTEQDFKSMLGKAPILIDFTANWCPNCKVLESTVLTPENLADWREEHNLVLLQADLTSPNIPAQALLKKLGSQSIPVVAIFKPGEDHLSPLVLRDLFTSAQLDAALESVLGAKK